MITAVASRRETLPLTGEFSGPRSPRAVNGGYGYNYPNPFQINYSSAITHFVDYSPTSSPVYSIDHAQYVVTVYFGGVGTSATVSW